VQVQPQSSCVDVVEILLCEGGDVE